MQMEVVPELIRIKREYCERCRKTYEMQRNAFSGQFAGMGYGYLQAETQRQGLLSNLIGGMGGAIGPRL